MKEFIEKLIGRLEEKASLSVIAEDKTATEFDIQTTLSFCLKEVIEIINQLAEEYKNAEEQGLLLRLPCKVGDTVYRLIPKTYRHIEPLKVSEFVICDNGLCFTTEKTNFHYSCEEFGEFIFLTKEEAEQALAEMKGEK